MQIFTATLVEEIEGEAEVNPFGTSYRDFESAFHAVVANEGVAYDDEYEPEIRWFEASPNIWVAQVFFEPEYSRYYLVACTTLEN